HIYPASNHNYMLFFTQKGRCYWLKVYEIPEGARNSKGRAIQNLLQIDQDDRVNAFIRVKGLTDPAFNTTHNLVFGTRRGFIKKTQLAAYSRPRAIGVNAIVIREDDEVISVRLTDGNSEIIMANRKGRAIRFNEQTVRSMGRTSQGVKAMTLDEGDEVVGMITMTGSPDETVMVVSENGYGKRSALDDYRITNRGGKGVKTMSITDKTGALVSIKNVNDSNDLMIINESGVTLRLPVADIRVMGRATQGVKLIDLGKRGDTIASVCKVDSQPEEEIEEELEAESEETRIMRAEDRVIREAEEIMAEEEAEADGETTSDGLTEEEQ
ncbi:MAG: DNA gyrase subunit A, partial [Muribaculaceae bacterium]|nr:DNA gyrase subunit A [Muribaculaceae bacterium]